MPATPIPRFAHVAIMLMLALLSAPAVGSSLTYMRLGQNVIAQRLKVTPPTQRDAMNRLRAQLFAIGIQSRHIQEQAVPGEAIPNLVITFPGSEPGAIVVAVPSSMAKGRSRRSVQWATLEMLAFLTDSAISVVNHHTLIFLAYPERNGKPVGLHWFLSHRTMDQIRCLISLSDLGLNPPVYFANPAGRPLIGWLNVSARELRLPPPNATTDPGKSDRNSSIPTLSCYSWAMERVGSRGIYLPNNSARVDLTAYYDTYRLLALLLIELDSRGIDSSGVMSKPAPNPTPAPPARIETLTQEQAEAQELQMFGKIVLEAGLRHLKPLPMPDLRVAACALASDDKVNHNQKPLDTPEVEQLQRTVIRDPRVLYALLDLTARPGEIVDQGSIVSQLREVPLIGDRKGITPSGYSVGACLVPGTQTPPRWWFVVAVTGVPR